MSFLRNLIGLGQKSQSILPQGHPLLREMDNVLDFEASKGHDFEHRVVPALNYALRYYEGQVANIPGALPMSVEHHHHDALLNALFPGTDDIVHAFGRSMDVRQSLPILSGRGQPELFALLGMRNKPELAPEGGLHLADHTLRSLASSEDEVRELLRDAALSRLFKAYEEHLDKLKIKRKLLKVEWNIENRPGGVPDDNPDEPFVYSNEALTPENKLRGLVAWLERPEDHLKVRPSDVRIMIGVEDGGASIYQDLPMMFAADRRHWVTCIVHFPTLEAVHAMNKENRIHRYIFI